MHRCSSYHSRTSLQQFSLMSPPRSYFSCNHTVISLNLKKILFKDFLLTSHPLFNHSCISLLLFSAKLSEELPIHPVGRKSLFLLSLEPTPSRPGPLPATPSALGLITCVLTCQNKWPVLGPLDTLPLRSVAPGRSPLLRLPFLLRTPFPPVSFWLLFLSPLLVRPRVPVPGGAGLSSQISCLPW